MDGPTDSPAFRWHTEQKTIGCSWPFLIVSLTARGLCNECGKWNRTTQVSVLDSLVCLIICTLLLSSEGLLELKWDFAGDFHQFLIECWCLRKVFNMDWDWETACYPYLPWLHCQSAGFKHKRTFSGECGQGIFQGNRLIIMYSQSKHITSKP